MHEAAEPIKSASFILSIIPFGLFIRTKGAQMYPVFSAQNATFNVLAFVTHASVIRKGISIKLISL